MNKCNSCPECGHYGYINKNLLGNGFRNCFICGQEWWVDIDYKCHVRQRLIPLSDFILQVGKNSCNRKLEQIYFNYAKFLKTEIEPYMFVQCDEDNNYLENECVDEDLCKYCPLEDFRSITAFSSGCEGSRCEETGQYYNSLVEEGQQRILFEDFNKSHSESVLHKTGLLRLRFNKPVLVEDLIKYNLKLTPTAQKLIWESNI